MQRFIALWRLVLLITVSFLWLIMGTMLQWITGHSVKSSRWVVQTWATCVLKILHIKINLYGNLPDLQAMVMANHRSYLDIFVLLAYFPESIVGKKELRKWPIIGQATKLARMVLVERTNVKSLFETMGKIEMALNSGSSVILFPEGTTFKGPHTLKFKTGGFAVASQKGIQVIPCAISYFDAEDAWVGNDYFIPHFINQMGKPLTEVNLWFGEPNYYPDARQLKLVTQDAINQMLVDWNKRKARAN
ncbi:MAG TPA: hypothetical protein DCQ26_11130 [Marinilabiliales bacterium]|jgi:1-acyl-sn-glycerol-3-phosphate acyltransferase|nr:MAG: hypothetical protein A2W84_00215 [Bacteroidetes bacterium GWC2_40_13]OFX71176.1 MAG: hypothetical protein A2W96_15700 [Bacteroidetes bacterium GWD2_40_43]OFX92341.1 MAG: hypothetical protein A2W97_10255 [Bacteroidetes bacterium GWE2_40_63]OFY22944.1 MAG: hypothetical protein A2W88_04240 [Bacteroidetes bacterium GWF2_40_13]HAM99150.1 hypothetical protein [Marinilabiliales bacterium]